jgi:hypothetical protein
MALGLQYPMLERIYNPCLNNGHELQTRASNQFLGFNALTP